MELLNTQMGWAREAEGVLNVILETEREGQDCGVEHRIIKPRENWESDVDS